MERQNVRLVLKVVNDLTLSALEIQNEKRCKEYSNNTSFVRILLILWKIYSVTHFEGIRSPSTTFSDDQLVLEPFLDGIGDLLSIEYT